MAELSYRDKVRRIRVTGLTIEQVAELLGVSSRTVRRWALEEHEPKAKNLRKIDALYHEREKIYRTR